MSKKDVGIRIRIDQELRSAFVSACQTQEMPASEVLREFMRQYSEQHNAQSNQLRLPLQNENNQL
jgi:antitoxin component of RelBE/YafQ-DinJ toxin-antitoxin module